MKNSAGMKNSEEEKTSCRLSVDILEYGILPCLPVKHLLRFQCVSKKWHRLISSDPYFICLQSRGPSCASGVAGFLCMEDVEEPAALISRAAVGIPPSFPKSHIRGKCANIVASSAGLLCIRVWADDGRPRVYIGNPAVKDWTCVDHIPADDTGISYFGLAVNVGERGVSYNLVVAGIAETPSLSSDDEYEYGFWVFSSTTQQWKVSSERIMLPKQQFDNVAVYVMGYVYWMIGDSHVLWFDPEEERRGLEPLPLPARPPNIITIGEWDGGMSYDMPTEIRRIGEWNGKLSFASMTDEEVQIWSMDRQWSWSKHVSIRSANIIGRIDPAKEFRAITSTEWWEPIVVKLLPFQGGDGLWFYWYRSMFCYDLVTGAVSKQADAYDPSSWFPYHNSLIYLPKGDV